MKDIAHHLIAYIESHPLDLGDSGCKRVLDQLYQAYAESHGSDPPEIGNGFKELEDYLHSLPLEDNNAVFNLCCRLCSLPASGVQNGCLCRLRNKIVCGSG